VRLDLASAQNLVQQCNCDVRQSLVHLQFLVKSGGGNSVMSRGFPLPKEDGGSCETVKTSLVLRQDSNSNNSCDSKLSSKSRGSSSRAAGKDDAGAAVDGSDDDFVALKPLKKRRRFLDEDNSSSADGVMTSDVPAVVLVEKDTVVAGGENCPPVHCIDTNLADRILQVLWKVCLIGNISNVLDIIIT